MLGSAMQDAQHDDWLTLGEAAAVLRCSPDTVRRRIRRGELVARQVARQLRVQVDGVHGSLHSTAPLHSSVPGNAVQEPGSAWQEQSEGLVELVRLVSRLQEENRNLAGQLGYTQAKLQEAQLALEAPREPVAPGTAHTAPPDTAAVESTQTPSTPPQRVPWWAVWRRVTS